MEKISRGISTYVCLGFLFCFIGWLYEVILAAVYGYGFVNRGFLYGPYLPVYGFGAIILIFCLERVMKTKLYIGKVLVTPLVVFFLIMLITTGIEYVTGFALEAIFHQRWWDYSGYTFNLNGFICLSASVRFGLGGMVFLYLLTPLFLFAIGRLPQNMRRWVAAAIVVVVALDFLITLLFVPEAGVQVTMPIPE